MSQMGSESTPPMSGDFSMPAEPAAWPKVIGIISIVWGSLGILCGLCMGGIIVAMGPFLEWAAKMQAQGGGPRGGQQQMPTTPFPVELRPPALSVVSAIAWPIGAIILLVAGIMLVKRSASARMAHLVYAVFSGTMTVVGLLGAYQSQSAVNSFLQAHPDDPWAKFFQQSGGGSSQFVQAAVGGCIALIYPAFCLIWFGMVKRRPEDMGPRAEEPLV